jgi:iron complex outermembrane receptor protein
MLRGLQTALVLLALGSPLGGHAVIAADQPAGPSSTEAVKDDAGTAAKEQTAPAEKSAAGSTKIGDLLNLDIEQLSKVPVAAGNRETNLTAPSNRLDAATVGGGEASTLGELLTQSPSVSAVHLSALNLDPRVRGYHAGQINASANGMTQLKTRVDLDSLFSQIDPGVVDRITIVDGPYSSLYGPGFAFLDAELLPTPQFTRPETHFSTSFCYGTNSQSLYTRENILSGASNWGLTLSYGLRAANDYTPGGGLPNVPSSYQKWDGLMALSYKLDQVSRVEFNYLRTEMNGLELPGVAYDIDNSTNNQFNVRYVIQEDPQGPQQLVLQSWWNQTYYNGNALNTGKQLTYFQPFFADVAPDMSPANTVGRGSLRSLGCRALRTFGGIDEVQWTVGSDWRRYEQRYEERNLSTTGELLWGDVFGIPKCRQDDVGVLSDVMVPFSDRLSANIGGRVDYVTSGLNANDPIITQWVDPDYDYYYPGFNEPNYTLGMAYVTGKYKLSEEYSVRTGAGFAMRAPNLTELYADQPYVPIARFGNSAIDGLSILKPESDLQFDLGLSRKTKDLSWSVRGFYSFIWNYIAPVPDYVDPSIPGAGTHVLGRNFQYFPVDHRTDYGLPCENADENMAGYQYWNLDLATLFGADLSVEKPINERLAVFGTMAYVRGTNHSPMAYYDVDAQAVHGEIIRYGGTDGLPGIYPLTGTVGVRLLAPAEDRWMLEFSSRMAAHQTHVARVLAETPNPGFAVFDLRGYYRLTPRVRLTMSIQNLFNTAYSEPGSLAIRDYGGSVTYVEETGFNAVFGFDARF